jgi:hypothetical protein
MISGGPNAANLPLEEGPEPGSCGAGCPTKYQQASANG